MKNKISIAIETSVLNEIDRQIRRSLYRNRSVYFEHAARKLNKRSEVDILKEKKKYHAQQLNALQAQIELIEDNAADNKRLEARGTQNKSLYAD